MAPIYREMRHATATRISPPQLRCRNTGSPHKFGVVMSASDSVGTSRLSSDLGLGSELGSRLGSRSPPRMLKDADRSLLSPFTIPWAH